MYRFISLKSLKDVNKAYLARYKKKESFNKKFAEAVDECPEIAGLLPPGTKGIDLLTYDFSRLVDLYYDYNKTLNDLHDDARVKEINDKFKAIFNYDSHREKIRRFLSDPNNGFEIHNCVYCDLNKVEGYTRANGNRNFEFHSDHVLDKGSCPLVALSIHNFVPSCPTCNEPPLKGVKPLGKTKADTLKISPKSSTNKFESDVKFILNITNKTIPDLELFKTNDGWEIDFSYKDGVYQQTVSMFDLKERYNAEKGYFKALDRAELAGNSDHYPFAQRTVPCIFFMNEGGDAFKYYHTVYDTWENSIFSNYEPIFNIIKDFIERY